MLRAASDALLVLVLALAVPVAQAAICEDVGGVLMTNIAAIDATYNLGPVFGDLQGSVAAKIVSVNEDGTFTLQHYWVTSTGDTILLKPAILHPVATSDPNVVAVLWGNYKSDIMPGGTGKFAKVHGTLSYFGLADFKQSTLVLRYRGSLCH
ncbi:MAG TPA: hypothetical protein VMT53_18895 [Terriglobales bacterium]|nr:hypothetical protein [Terriglobales bacterium]